MSDQKTREGHQSSLTQLEREVVDAALDFRKAERAHWIESEVGNDPTRTHHERATAYVRLVNACDALRAARLSTPARREVEKT